MLGIRQPEDPKKPIDAANIEAVHRVVSGQVFDVKGRLPGFSLLVISRGAGGNLTSERGFVVADTSPEELGIQGEELLVPSQYPELSERFPGIADLESELSILMSHMTGLVLARRFGRREPVFVTDRTDEGATSEQEKKLWQIYGRRVAATLRMYLDEPLHKPVPQLRVGQSSFLPAPSEKDRRGERL